MYGLAGGLYTIDNATGAATLLTGLTCTCGGTVTGSQLSDLSILNGVLYATGIEGADFYFGTINPATGAFTPISSTSNNPGLAANPSMGIFYSEDGDTELATLTTSGTLTDVGSFRNAVSIVDLAYDAVDGILYGVDEPGSSAGPSLYTINTSTGAATLVGLMEVGENTVFDGSIGYDNLNSTLYFEDGVSGSDTFYTVNTTTGVATLVGSNGVNANFFGLADVPLDSPEPATGALIAIGLTGLAFVRRLWR
jgi:hypothetical protein